MQCHCHSLTVNNLVILTMIAFIADSALSVPTQFTSEYNLTFVFDALTLNSVSSVDVSQRNKH